MIFRSLSSRLLITVSIFLVLSLSVSGYALDRAFHNSVQSALTEKLKAHIYALLADADNHNGVLIMPEQLQEPLFNRIDSGLYAVISDQQNQEIWRSPSAIALAIAPPLTAQTGNFRLTRVTGTQPPLYALSYGVIWEQEDGSESRYQINLLQSASSTNAQIAEFRGSLWRWFSGIGIILLLIQGSIMRWGLTPLRQLARELSAIESGRQDQLTGLYPAELKGVTHNLNLLINNERRQRQRYRDTLADLAHSLKTPLAILRGLTFNTPTGSNAVQQRLAEQVARMDEIVSHQLQRAGAGSIAPGSMLSLKAIRLSSLADKLLRTMSKVYADKKITVDNQIADTLECHIDESDLMEILGNLLDNAFKACLHRVNISAQMVTGAGNAAASGKRDNRCLIIKIEDDGHGIPAEQRSLVLERGVRADTHHSGQGIGLTVARDILHSYHGALHIDQSSQGGALISIELPQP